ARLAGSRQARDDDEAVARDLDGDVLEVVHPRALDGNDGARGRSLVHRGFQSSSSGGRFGSSRWTNASSCTSTLLFFVSRAGTDTLPTSPWSARYSHAVVTWLTSRCRAKWLSSSAHERASPISRR